MLGRDEDIRSALGSSASNIYVEVFVGNVNWTFVPLGIEPRMIKTQDDPQQIIFNTDITGSRVTNVIIRFKIVKSGDDPTTMYAVAITLGAIFCTIGYYLLRKRRFRSPEYRL